MPRAPREIPASRSIQWLMRKRENTRAKAKTTVKARGDVRPATQVAKARTLAKAREAAQPTEANRLKCPDEILAAYLSRECGDGMRGPEFPNSPPRIRNESANIHFFLRVLMPTRG